MKRVVVLGAGAIGSTVAMRLALTGHDVTVVARGSRLETLRSDGAIVTVTGQRIPVRISDSIPSCDLVIVPVRPWQVEAVLPMLKACGAPVMFMFNEWRGVQALREAVGRERFAWGFPAIVAALRDGKLEAQVVPRALERVQITTIGALRDFRPAWLDGWAKAFTDVGIPTVECSDMEAWLSTHAAVMAPLMAAGVRAQKRLTWSDAKAVVQAWREGVRLVRARGLEVTPSAIDGLVRTPAWLLTFALWLVAKFGALSSLADNGAQEPRYLLEAMAREPGAALSSVQRLLTSDEPISKES